LTGIRTTDLLIAGPLLYNLSYGGSLILWVFYTIFSDQLIILTSVMWSDNTMKCNANVGSMLEHIYMKHRKIKLPWLGFEPQRKLL
jgi:hypothetical protein